MTSALRFVLADHLSRSISSLDDLDPAHDVVLMVEVQSEATYVRHHKKKIAFLFSAMRHFAEELRAEGVAVDYVTLDDGDNQQSFEAELERAIRRHRPERVVVSEPGEWRVLDAMLGWEQRLRTPLEIRPDDRFLCSRDEFGAWAEGRQGLRMEFFYRVMRQRHGFLLDAAGEPAGGQWNYDVMNRKPPRGGLRLPEPLRVEPDRITHDVLNLVAERFDGHFGDLEPFWFAVTAADARRAFEHFVRAALPAFGDYQDAMLDGEDYLYHSVISQYLNAGLLLPLPVCRTVERAFRKGQVPLNAAEGYIRQILGWREYVRGIYWWRMPHYAATNHLDATRPLPEFFWTGETDMRCIARVVDQTRREAHSHHIQRLMVTGNFAMLAGIRPKDVNDWYLVVYADAFEWAQLPNTHGMAIYADGGLLGSKPYAAGGNYINRMSDFCRHCRYDVRQRQGKDACPFNYLYWDFMYRNRKKIGRNQRLSMVYRTLERMAPERLQAIRRDASDFLEGLEPAGDWT